MEQEQKEQIREEFRIKHFDFAGGEPVGTDEIAYFWLSKIDSLLTSQRDSLVEKIKETQEKYCSQDKKTKEKIYLGGGNCRTCGKRKDSLEIEEIITLIKQNK